MGKKTPTPNPAKTKTTPKGSDKRKRLDAVPPAAETFDNAAPTIPAPPPVVKMALGSWDGPEDDLSSLPSGNASNHPSLAPTPSLMPAVRAAKRARITTLLVMVGAAVLLGGGIAMGVSTEPEDQGPPGEQPEAVASRQSLVEGQEALGGGSQAGGARGEVARRGSSTTNASIGASGRGGESSESSALGVTDGHGAGAQDISGGGIGSSGVGRQVRSLSDDQDERVGRRRGGSSGGRALSNEQVRGAIVSNSSSIRSCHEREMRRTGMPIEARVVVRIQVGRSGTVRSAQVLSGSPPGTPLTACLERSISAWRFPEASGETVVETPFNLSTRN